MGLSWLDLRANKEQYADDLTIEVNGEKMTLGDFRKELGPVSEFTKQTQKLAQERDQAMSAYQQSQAQVQQHQALLAQMQQARQQAVQTNGVNPLDPMNPYRQDAAFSPLVTYYDQQIEQLKGLIQQQASHMQQANVAMNAWRYSTQIDKLKTQYPDLDPQRLAQYTTEFYTKGPDVEAAHKLMTYEDRIKRAEQDAERRGYERAKAEPPAPPMPGGRRGGMRPADDIQLPKSLDARATLALQDGELMTNLAAGLQELSNG